MPTASISDTAVITDAESSPRGLSDETANWLTHAAGFCLSLIGAAVLVLTAVQSGDANRIVGCAIYALTLVSLYAASTLSHSFDDPDRRRFFRMLDQVCIFLLVVGTYTPFGLVHAWNDGWWLVMLAMWTCALAGIAQRIRNPETTLRPWLFVIIAWLPISTMGHAYAVSHTAGLSLVFAGGLAYMGGLWFLLNDHRRRFYHAAWHLSTITGSTFHYLFVLYYVATPPL